MGQRDPGVEVAGRDDVGGQRPDGTGGTDQHHALAPQPDEDRARECEPDALPEQVSAAQARAAPGRDEYQPDDQHQHLLDEHDDQ